MNAIIKRAAILGALGALFLGSAAGPSYAEGIEVKVPFPFVVQGRTLPKGEYNIQPVSFGSSALLIRGEKGTKGGAIVQTHPASGHDPVGDKPALTFTRYENQYRLSTIWESAMTGLALSGK
jgi:hypothetical protein